MRELVRRELRRFAESQGAGNSYGYPIGARAALERETGTGSVKLFQPVPGLDREGPTDGSGTASDRCAKHSRRS